jgi:hypothetical protein
MLGFWICSLRRRVGLLGTGVVVRIKLRISIRGGR